VVLTTLEMYHVNPGFESFKITAVNWSSELTCIRVHVPDVFGSEANACTSP